MNPQHSNAPTGETVIACSLTGTDQADRAVWLERLRQRSITVVGQHDGVTVRFPATDEIESDVRALAAAETLCCPFLELAVVRQPDTVELRVTGPPEAREIIDAMFEAGR